jgi:hypothetical protein
VWYFFNIIAFEVWQFAGSPLHLTRKDLEQYCICYDR